MTDFRRTQSAACPQQTESWRCAKGCILTDDDFANIERTLSVILPSPYRRLMAEYPFGEESRPAQAYVPNNATYVCNLNLQIRNDAVYRTLWGQTDFAMGTTWGGDAYVLDTTPNDSPVCRLSQESLIVTTVATTLDSWFSELVNC